MQRLPSERVPLVIGEGDFAGVSIEVERLASWMIGQTAVRAVAAFYAAGSPAEEMAALLDVYAIFTAEAQPTWDLADHRGPIPPTADGMWRLPLPLALEFVSLWVEPPTSAVDETVPPGPVRDELNKRLRKARQRED